MQRRRRRRSTHNDSASEWISQKITMQQRWLQFANGEGKWRRQMAMLPMINYFFGCFFFTYAIVDETVFIASGQRRISLLIRKHFEIRIDNILNSLFFSRSLISIVSSLRNNLFFFFALKAEKRKRIIY